VGEIEKQNGISLGFQDVYRSKSILHDTH